MSHNQVLQGLIASFSKLLHNVAAALEESEPNYARSEYISHEVLYKAIASRNRNEITRVMEKHLRYTENVLLTNEEPAAGQRRTSVTFGDGPHSD